MNLHTAPENKLFSTVRHGLFTPQYEKEIQELFAEFQVLENSFSSYHSIPLSRKLERLKKSNILFRIYWQNVLKLLLPFTQTEKLNSQRLFMRYSLLHLADLTAEDLEALEIVALHTEQANFVYYIDEWFHNIATGAIEAIKDSSHNKTLPSRSKKDSEHSSSNVQLTHEAIALERVVEKFCSQNKFSASPFLHKNDLLHPIMHQITSREAVQKMVTLVRNIDPEIFTRKLLKETIDLEPYIILVPSYAEFGICWEAFDRLERNSSRGRIVLPLYAPNTRGAVLVAMANYRWETAKLAAGSYWLEKGLTGGFYDLYRKLSLPGKNEQQAFVAAYCQWILDESRGQIKFHPELRRFFWLQIPFEQNRRNMLTKYFAHFRDIHESS